MASSYNPYQIPRRYSKSQMYFFKILHIISSIPPSNSNTNLVPFDLNLNFSSITQDSESSTETTITSNNDQQQHEQEQKHEQEQEMKVVEQVDDVAMELENEHEIKTETSSFPRGDYNCFDLLIEAARVLSEKNNESDDSVEKKEIGTELMTREENEREPVVRSKRGRNQLLPCRFRDSVVEPLKRTGRNQRLSFTTTTNAKKRLLR